MKLPPAKDLIGCKYVFNSKQKADRNVDCYKVRLAAKGYFDQTFALVAKHIQSEYF